MAISNRRALTSLVILVLLPLLGAFGYLQWQRRDFLAHERRALATVTYVGERRAEDKTVALTLRFTAADGRVYSFAPVIGSFDVPPVGQSLFVRYDVRDPLRAYLVRDGEGPPDYGLVILVIIGWCALQLGIYRLNKWRDARREKQKTR
ncbi:MAG TPA: DUF3592 domain-containing protein [Polyangia bacterium]|nr:DUF3592 domain-containing protein [Polyangia bacterium]